MLRRLVEPIGTALRTVRYRNDLERLLTETQRQAEELQSQQEELRVNNEELEQQSRALQESQGRLQNQKAELEALNATLEEQNDAVLRERDNLERAQNELVRANAYKSEFLANMSHELRTPLNSSLILAKLLAENRSGNLTGEQIKFADTIYSAGNDLLTLINDILDLSKIEAGKLDVRPEIVSIARLVDDLKTTFEPVAKEKALELATSATGAPDGIETDPTRLQQILRNLLSNAVKFTDTGGRITLAIAQQNSQVSLTVEDDGRGIEPAFLPLVFDRFKQADSTTTRRIGGLGLGLALVRHIVELHGGRVTAASAGLGKGAKFGITLPIRAVPDASKPSTGTRSDEWARAVPSIQNEGLRVLVVDDEADARELVASILSAGGARVETARSASEGLEVFKRFRPDVLVSDIGMPDEDGYSFIRRVRALSDADGGRVPALALTAFAREEDRTKSLTAGFTTHIGKPVNPDALSSAVANLAMLRPRS
jgi:signal transduction histidine kinase/ActR/RegA family two-component response regulator